MKKFKLLISILFCIVFGVFLMFVIGWVVYTFTDKLVFQHMMTRLVMFLSCLVIFCKVVESLLTLIDEYNVTR